jgi:hypothetical protein
MTPELKQFVQHVSQKLRAEAAKANEELARPYGPVVHLGGGEDPLDAYRRKLGFRASLDLFADLFDEVVKDYEEAEAKSCSICGGTPERHPAPPGNHEWVKIRAGMGGAGSSSSPQAGIPGGLAKLP